MERQAIGASGAWKGSTRRWRVVFGGSPKTTFYQLASAKVGWEGMGDESLGGPPKQHASRVRSLLLRNSA